MDCKIISKCSQGWEYIIRKKGEQRLKSWTYPSAKTTGILLCNSWSIINDFNLSAHAMAGDVYTDVVNKWLVGTEMWFNMYNHIHIYTILCQCGSGGL